MGGKIHGDYPLSLDETKSPMVIDRGRMIPTMSFESMWAPVLEWTGMSADDYDEVLPNWIFAGTEMIPKSDVYANSTMSAARAYAKYGHKMFLRIKDSLIWLEDSYGEAVYTSDPGSESKTTELNHVWIVRSEEGSGLRTDSDPKAGNCIKYGDKIYLQSNRVDNHGCREVGTRVTKESGLIISTANL